MSTPAVERVEQLEAHARELRLARLQLLLAAYRPPRVAPRWLPSQRTH